jgi:hypothetical protein
MIFNGVVTHNPMDTSIHFTQRPSTERQNDHRLPVPAFFGLDGSRFLLELSLRRVMPDASDDNQFMKLIFNRAMISCA